MWPINQWLHNINNFYFIYLSASVQFFLWQTCHKSLPTRSILCHRRVLLTPTCPFCSEDETISHCLMLCPRSVEIWTDCGFSDVQAMCHKVGLDNISKILATLMDGAGILAPLIMWNIWISRNKFIFEGTTPVKYQIMTSIFTQLHVSNQAFESPTSHSHRAIREVYVGIKGMMMPWFSMSMEVLLLIQGRQGLVAWCVTMMEHFNLVSMECRFI